MANLAYLSSTRGPVPGDNIRVAVTGGNTLTFSDGHSYAFRDPSLLAEALRVKHWPQGVLASALPTFAPWLAKVGDSHMQTICRGQMYRNKELNEQIWQRRYAHGMGTNFYLSWQCDLLGVYHLMTKDGLPVAQWEAQTGQLLDHIEKATAVEALIGAVSIDSGEDNTEVREVMRRLGVWWPCTELEGQLVDDYLQLLRTFGVVF